MRARAVRGIAGRARSACGTARRARAIRALAIATGLAFAGLDPGCGRLGFTERDNRDAAIGPRDGSPDAATTCNPAAPFGTPVAIAELNDPTKGDGTLRLLPDELSGYFWSFRGSASAQLYLATRPDLATPFTITPVQGLAVAGSALDPTISADGTFLVFRHNSPGDDLYQTIRTGSPDMFGPASAIANLDSGATEVQPFLQLGGNELYFSSDRTGGGDIYRSPQLGTAFGAPALVAELASTSDDGDPVIAPDGLTIYFRSSRPATPLGYNIYVATRATTGGTFGSAQLVPNVNSDSDDGPSWISPDGCRLYISSSRAGTNDIYVSTRGS